MFGWPQGRQICVCVRFFPRIVDVDILASIVGDDDDVDDLYRRMTRLFEIWSTFSVVIVLINILNYKCLPYITKY